MVCLKQTGIVVVAGKVCNLLHPNQTKRHFERAADAQVACLKNQGSAQLQEITQQKNIIFSQIEALNVQSQQEIESQYQASYNELTEEFAKSQKLHEESLIALSFFWIYAKAVIDTKEANNVLGISYKNAVKEETARFTSLVSEHEAVLEALSIDRDMKLAALTEFMDTQVQDVENQYNADIQAITATVKKVVNEVNSSLQNCLKSLDSSRKGMALNGMLIMGASCAVFAAPALLTAAAGKLAVGAVQVSAATTGLGAANNLFNNNGAVGVTFTFNLSQYTTKPYVAPPYKAPSFQKDIVLPDNHPSGIELNLFNNNRISGRYNAYNSPIYASGQANNYSNSDAYAVTQSKSNISITNSENSQATYKAPRIEYKQIPNIEKPKTTPNKTGAINWPRMAWRAVNLDKSPEVISWQQNNRNRFPKMAAFFDSIANSKSQRMVNAFADEFAGRPVRFVENELSLIKQREKTQTAQFISNAAESLRHAQEFVAQDAGRLVTGDTTKTEIFFEMVGKFLEADFDRLTKGQATVIGTAIAEDFKAMASMTPEQLAAHLGHEAGDAFLMFLGGGALQAGGRAMTKAMDTVINVSKELKATYTLRSPLLFQFEEAKLYNGFPFDAVKVQKPNVAKVAETEVIVKDIVQGYAHQKGLSAAKNELLFSKQAKFDFAQIGYLDGQLYPSEKLLPLGNYLHKRGVDVNTITKGSPAFQARNPLTGKPTLYLPEKPTMLQVKHELSHYLDYKRLGLEKYSKLSTLEKEQLVLERLQNKKPFWEELTAKEQAFSAKYVRDIANAIKNVKIEAPKNVN